MCQLLSAPLPRIQVLQQYADYTMHPFKAFELRRFSSRFAASLPGLESARRPGHKPIQKRMFLDDISPLYSKSAEIDAFEAQTLVLFCLFVH